MKIRIALCCFGVPIYSSFCEMISLLTDVNFSSKKILIFMKMIQVYLRVYSCTSISNQIRAYSYSAFEWVNYTHHSFHIIDTNNVLLVRKLQISRRVIFFIAFADSFFKRQLYHKKAFSQVNVAIIVIHCIFRHTHCFFMDHSH